MKLVVDNSVVMRWLFKDGSDLDRLYATRVAQLVETSEVFVPAMFIAEAANVISKALKVEVISRVHAQTFFELINHMQAQVVPPTQGTQEVMFFTLRACELDLSAYDATYLLLAEHLSCPLATLDKDLRKAAKKHGVAIAALDQE